MSQNNTVLIGMKGCGKTTYGKQLAKKLNKTFVDVDQEIEKLYQQECALGLRYPEIHQRIGEQAFRALEQRAIFEIAKHSNQVIATGGSSLMDQENQAALQDAEIIYLYIEAEKLLPRWQQHPPSFIDGNNMQQELVSYFQVRDNLYKQIADKIITLD